jgi:hypothetical protein
MGYEEFDLENPEDIDLTGGSGWPSRGSLIPSKCGVLSQFSFEGRSESIPKSKLASNRFSKR